MVNALLCQSAAIAAAVSGAADLLGGIGANYAQKDCNPAKTGPVAYMKLHGMEDPSIPYDQVPGKEVLVDNVEFLGAKDTVAVRARANGCGPDQAGDIKEEAGGKMKCTDLCAKAEPGSPPTKLCGMPGVGHETDKPYPGFAYQQAWSFFDAAPPKAGYAAAKAMSTDDVHQSTDAGVPAGAVTMNASMSGEPVTRGALAAKAAAASEPAGSTGKGGGVNVAAVAGGVAGGVVAGVGAIGAALYGSIRKRRKFMDSLDRLPYSSADAGADDTAAGKDQAADMVVVAGDVAGANGKGPAVSH